MAKADSQQTIQNEITMTGKGLMLGEPVTLTLKPAPADSGIVFRRVDMEGMPEVEVCPENWADILPRCTSLRSGDTTVSSVE
ncbi:MAG: UDP-3-O-acyl-N-acetylglucosamine deacetylase, partial [Candidatus Poribacteria bacterium]|nr:UDP-3-O-acyl-N-acetylglucosamine deacetylase [Candidatus Poribacteria bacterium]